MIDSTATPILIRIGRTNNTMPCSFTHGNTEVAIYINDVDMLPHLTIRENERLIEDTTYEWDELDLLEYNFNTKVANA